MSNSGSDTLEILCLCLTPSLYYEERQHRSCKTKQGNILLSQGTTFFFPVKKAAWEQSFFLIPGRRYFSLNSSGHHRATFIKDPTCKINVYPPTIPVAHVKK